MYTLQTAVNQQAQQASQQPQQPLVVNPKTKTALANMLSIRLQSGTTGAPHLSPQQPGAQVNYVHQDLWIGLFLFLKTVAVHLLHWRTECKGWVRSSVSYLFLN